MPCRPIPSVVGPTPQPWPPSVPEASRVFWEAGVAGKMEEMKRIYDERIEPVMKVRSLREGYGASGIKVALEELGRAGGPVLPPGTQVLPEDRAKLGEIVRKYAEKPLLCELITAVRCKKCRHRDRFGTSTRAADGSMRRPAEAHIRRR